MCLCCWLDGIPVCHLISLLVELCLECRGDISVAAVMLQRLSFERLYLAESRLLAFSASLFCLTPPCVPLLPRTWPILFSLAFLLGIMATPSGKACRHVCISVSAIALSWWHRQLASSREPGLQVLAVACFLVFKRGSSLSCCINCRELCMVCRTAHQQSMSHTCQPGC